MSQRKSKKRKKTKSYDIGAVRKKRALLREYFEREKAEFPNSPYLDSLATDVEIAREFNYTSPPAMKYHRSVLGLGNRKERFEQYTKALNKSKRKR